MFADPNGEILMTYLWSLVMTPNFATLVVVGIILIVGQCSLKFELDKTGRWTVKFEKRPMAAPAFNYLLAQLVQLVRRLRG